MYEICSRCNGPVSPWNRKYALGKIWHQRCFSCSRCNKQLNNYSTASHNGQLFCRNCYNFHKLPPHYIKLTQEPSNQCKICNCKNVCSKNSETCGQCKFLLNPDLTKSHLLSKSNNCNKKTSNLSRNFCPSASSTINNHKSNMCSKSNFGNKNISNLSNMKFCPSASSTINKATSTCSMSNNRRPTSSSIFKLINNESCSPKANKNESSAGCTFNTGHLLQNEWCPLREKSSPCQTEFRYLYKDKKQFPQFSNSNCSAKNCPSKTSKCDVGQQVSRSCCQASSRNCPDEKSGSKSFPKHCIFNQSSLPKDSQRNKFVILALPVLGEMEM